MFSPRLAPSTSLLRAARGFCLVSLSVGVAFPMACSLTSEPLDPELVVASNLAVDAGAEGELQRDASSLTRALEALPDAGCQDDGCCSSDGCAVPNACDEPTAAGCSIPLEGSTACEQDDECAERVCIDGVCAAARCDDGRRNGSETDVDCGASCQQPCAQGLACAARSDCQSGSCLDGRCAAPACNDNVRNQAETDVDCGGDCPDPCGRGLSCEVDGDCAAGLFCPSETAQCTDVSCTDEVRNGQESSVDCGGGVCPGCPVGSPCTAGGDCGSGVCAAGLCAQPTCFDGVVNQDETAQDCGGSCGDTCTPGQPCVTGADCQSLVCSAVACSDGDETCCQEATCDDGVANGLEPVADCGSAQCGLCPVASPCTAGPDCATGLCVGGVCVPIPCADGERGGSETDVDCGGDDPACGPCAEGASCRVDDDCATGSCQQETCVACSDGQVGGTETGEDCGGLCGPCAEGIGCRGDTDCDSGVCVSGLCCGGTGVNCTRCALRLAAGVDCSMPGDPASQQNCETFLQCLSDNPAACPSRNAPGCAGPGDVCDTALYGGLFGPGVQRAGQILGTARCAF